jgi:hypothetical protein
VDYTVEERTEVCSTSSKLVNLKIYRAISTEQQGEGEIMDFHCNQSSMNCESRCTYKMLLSDY